MSTFENDQFPEIKQISIEEEMKSSYLDYAMSVIVSRALPDVRDGLKPVHRRILYAMKEGGYDSTKPYKKSARIVGDVMGKYHPHGDTAIYDSMVRLAQDFSLRLPLIDGQGNFGSMDGDRAAAMRYTEARLEKSAEAILLDIEKDTVDFQPNYDGSVKEPTVLPSRIPNLLVNGAGGIAVGMATNIPPHNLGEVIDGCCAYVDNPEITVEELVDYVPGPDFPTGGQILGAGSARQSLMTGKCSVMMRGKTIIEEIRKDREAIIISEVPYQVNKAKLVERIAELTRSKQIEGISDIRDESDRDGIRIVIEIKRDAIADVVLNQLYSFTSLRSSFGVNILALNKGHPIQMNLRDIIEAFVDFREEVITRRTAFELKKAREKGHVLVGLAVAVSNLDPVIQLIKSASDPQDAREKLLAQTWKGSDVGPFIELMNEPNRKLDSDGMYQFSETQARAILDLKLHRLTGLERDKIGGDLQLIADEIKRCLDILKNRESRLALLKDELVEIKEKFATPRRTEIIEGEFDTNIEDLIQKEDMVVTVTNTGYVKRVPLDTYRAQRRGGKGRSGMSTKDEDHVTEVFVANTHTALLFFSSFGMVYKMKVYKLPIGSPQSRGKAMINILPLKQGEVISTVMPLPEDETQCEDQTVVFATASGGIRRNKLSDFVKVQANGKIAMKLDEGDALIGVQIGESSNDILLATSAGKAIRFRFDDVRVFGSRNSTGVRGIKLSGDDRVISLSVLTHMDCTSEERALYLKQANQMRRAGDEEEITSDDIDTSIEGQLSPERFAEFAENEQFLLTVSDTGFGKRTSSYEYRITGRGGQGIKNIGGIGEKNKAVVATFAVKDYEQIMLVTDQGQLIRMNVDSIRIAGRSAMGVTLFKVGDASVVSVAHLETDEDDASDEDSNDHIDSSDNGPEISENTDE